jgi:hypothetical protein
VKGGAKLHGYLRSIGFKDLKKKNEIDLLIQDIVDHPDKKILTEDEEGNIFAELTREFSEFTGIAVRGFYIDNEFHVEYYYPYFAGSGISTEERVDIQKRSDREAYAGICDEMRIGVTLIFYLQNAVEYLQEQRTKNGKRVPSNTTISALSASGKIVLPVYKNENQIKSGEKYTNNRNHLMAAARDGDEDAMESLTLEDIDTYSMISRRIMTEDILSIVDTYFMPYGIESDQYSIMGEILDFYTIENKSTREKSYVLTLNSNHLVFDVCINQADLLGEPAVGRRFKGAIWMQGQLNYQM